ncbi:MAG: aminotransferase class I/II-fold pyridoxal phosphate-dependent enzyme [Acidimicrobiales bacterium]|jgi:dTDP-4-amino-4,6-dideoxygalactose transaminase
MINSNPVRVSASGLDAVAATLKSGVVARGPCITALEQSFLAVTRAENAVAVANGTVALVLAGMATGIAPDDTVLVSGFSFASTANAFLALGCRVVAVDISPDSYNIDDSALADAIRRYPQARALVVVDLFGNTAGTDEAIATARQHGLVVIEDAAQAVGAHDSVGEPIGRRADVTTFSLYATKNVFAGEGGVVVSPNTQITDRVRALADHQTIEVDGRRLIGLNYRMNELGAALALTQMPMLAEFTQRRRDRARQLADACIEAWPNSVTVPPEASRLDDQISPRHVFHQFTVSAYDEAMRGTLQDRLRQHDVETRRFYPYALSSLPGMAASPTPLAEDLATRCFSLPIAHALTEEEFGVVLEAVRNSGD